MVLTPDTKASTPNIAIYKLTGMIKANMGKGLMDLMYMHRERFTILIKALDAAGLTDTLQKSAHFYLFNVKKYHKNLKYIFIVFKNQIQALDHSPFLLL